MLPHSLYQSLSLCAPLTKTFFSHPLQELKHDNIVRLLDYQVKMLCLFFPLTHIRGILRKHTAIHTCNTVAATCCQCLHGATCDTDLADGCCNFSWGST